MSHNSIWNDSDGICEVSKLPDCYSNLNCGERKRTQERRDPESVIYIFMNVPYSFVTCTLHSMSTVALAGPCY